jgi:predicted nucleic acid-binding protein
MARLIFIDSNIPMYLVGQPHPHKADAQRVLERLIATRERLVTSVGVYEEILHRYVAIKRRDAIAPAVEALSGIVDDVFPIRLEDVTRAQQIVLAYPLASRDALHVAVMEAHGVEQILSFDAGFDEFPGVTRIAE